MAHSARPGDVSADVTVTDVINSCLFTQHSKVYFHGEQLRFPNF